ncbi:MAG TPA: hypothetical protein IAB27_05330 [Candidatus Coprosoma intestinipullorum]|uniref:Uncharacterized protein n=1 Tax=Candidatus Coprosoma intestinipullorum TaxID=2840752 RepID=A0A9D0ZRP0_9FIRM|nr:hypothetical protein [Candidatus Coprosoma intestinipullorum]
MTNLLEETKNYLRDNNKTIDDIKWVGNNKFYFDVNEFLNIANVEYDSGYGAPEVAQDLLVVGDNWWLERHEYDGSEWWEYKEIPLKPNKKIELKALTISQAKKLGYDVSVGWENLKSINNIEGDNK